MAKQYTKEEILQRCDEAIEDIGNFYKQEFLNYRGTTDKGELYTEIIAGFIIKHIEVFKNNIKPTRRDNSYKMDTHNGEYDEKSMRVEDITAIKMFNQCKEESLDHIGKIIDYQTPLSNKQGDGLGKIDLLADDGKQLIILELKRFDSEETMLRCVMEGYTYLKTVDKQKLLADFGCPENYGLSASPFVFKDGAQYREMQKDRPNLKRLMELLESKPYFITEDNEEFSVTEKIAKLRSQKDSAFLNKIKEIGFETICGGLLGVIAIIAAILSTIKGGADESMIWGCVKDVAGTLVSVVLLFVAIKVFLPKKKVSFLDAFREEMDRLMTKHDPIFGVDYSEKGLRVHRHTIASRLDLDAMMGNSKITMISFFDFDIQKPPKKSTITFLIHKTNFKDSEGTDRTKAVAKNIRNALSIKFPKVVEPTCDNNNSCTVSVKFKTPLENKESAKLVADVIDYVIFCFIAEYKK